ncbi:MAG: maleylpyruvate isomerase family mycothiol-dependent enzyme [Acidimicrobiales bacterium]
MPNPTEALRSSTQYLREIVESLDAEQLRASAYPTEWTIADVLSHLGSGSIIFMRQVDDALSTTPTPSDFARSVWNEWDAKSPDDQARDLLLADRALVTRIDELSTHNRDRIKISMGPFALDFNQYLGLRINEHVLHTWDIDVVLNSNAVLPGNAVDALLGNLGMIASFAAKPMGTERTYVLQTFDPVKTYTVSLTPDSVTTVEGDSDQ